MLLKTSYTGCPALKKEKLQLSNRTYTQKIEKLQQIRAFQGIILDRIIVRFFLLANFSSGHRVYRGKVVK
jgi:hypothetical protein